MKNKDVRKILDELESRLGDHAGTMNHLELMCKAVGDSEEKMFEASFYKSLRHSIENTMTHIEFIKHDIDREEQQQISSVS